MDTMTGRELLGADLFERLAARITDEHTGFDRPFAERIVDQSAAFLAACAVNGGEPLAPSRTVDIGWHTFILHTRDYATFCERIAGRFLHHVPETPEQGEPSRAAAERERTSAAITAAGYALDGELWPAAADCTQCHAGCSNSPVGK